MSSAAISAIDLIARVSLLLGVGALAALVLHRRSAAFRHLLWSAALGGALFLAVITPWAPRLDLPVKGWARDGTPDAVVPFSTALETLRSSALPGGALVNDLPATDVARLARTRTNFARAGAPAWLVLWLAGASLIVAWGLAGRLGLVQLLRRAQPVTDGPWRASVDRTAASMGIRRPIAIFMSAEVGAPMTWGAMRPVVVVPTTSEHWADDLRESVVAHEVAHMARHDYVLQLMAMVTCAIYWFHPLVWMIAHRMRQAAEKACDDQVLKLGTTGEEYATQLIGIARVSQHRRLSGAVAIGMARPSTLEGRIVAVLDSSRARNEPTTRGRRIVGLTTAAALIVFGVVRPVPEASAAFYANDWTTVQLDPAPDSDETSSKAPIVSAPPPETQTINAQDRDSTFERSLSASAGGVLVLDLNAGGGVTVRGWDEPRVSVRARLGGLHWRDVEVDIERESDGVRVGSRFTRRSGNQSTSNQFEINVPRRYDVRISSSGGSFTLVNLDGRFTGHTGGGDLVLERLTGSARLTTGGGEILVSDSDLSGTVRTGGGLVRISNVRGGLRGSSGSGPVIYGESVDGSRRSTTDISSVQVGRDGASISVGRTEYRSGTLNITKAGGSVDLDAAPNGAVIHTGGGNVNVGRSVGLVDATTGGGDVEIGPVAGSARASTGAGEVRIVVDKVRDGDQTIEASSGKGRIIIELPADFEGRLDLETAHTRTHEETARIRSDWELERQPLTDWDDRYGTPRRFLRATAVIGRGNGRVVVRTVNGEIEIRRR